MTEPIIHNPLLAEMLKEMRAQTEHLRSISLSTGCILVVLCAFWVIQSW